MLLQLGHAAVSQGARVLAAASSSVIAAVGLGGAHGGDLGESRAGADVADQGRGALVCLELDLDPFVVDGEGQGKCLGMLLHHHPDGVAGGLAQGGEEVRVDDVAVDQARHDEDEVLGVRLVFPLDQVLLEG